MHAPLRSVADAGPPAVEPLLDAKTTVTGEALAWPKGPPVLKSQIVTIGPGQSTGWHRHTAPTYGQLLSGVLEVEYEGLGRRTLRVGDTLLESMRVAHAGTNLGTEPVRILVVVMGVEGKAGVVRADPPRLPAVLGGRREAALREADLVDLAAADPRLRLEIRYAGSNNFTGAPVYRSARAFLQRPAAEALRRVHDRARAEGYGLVVFDAYRPWSVTRMFWDRYPMHRDYLADPLEGSRHNRGCAVDLSLFDLRSGSEVAMPSAYDDFSERAHPTYAGGTAAERKARDLLRSWMEAEGFTVHDHEWWHFDYRGWQDWRALDLPFEELSLKRTSAEEKYIGV
jgi:D-alanyl-D-alanine dipeptidase